MKVLIKQATIICSPSPFNGQVKDILIVDGKIQNIADNISESADETIEKEGLHISIGWMDIFARFGEPGYEHKETIMSGAKAAAAGGFTSVMILPNTSPVISSKSQVEYVLQKAAATSIDIYPIGSVTKNAEGKELSEMYDMHASGAKFFSDGINAIQSPGILLKALQYIKAIDATIIQLPEEKSLSNNGLMNEGITSTRLGLPGKPAISEELMVARDIELLKYTGSRLHITGITTLKSIEHIRQAKIDGLAITCSVTPYHCFFNDEDLVSYDTNLKVNPPLRTKINRDALLNAVADGTVDCIASHHMPEHWDDKTCEFEYAKNGMIGLETVYSVMNTLMNDIGSLIEKLTTAPRKIFGITLPEMKEGAEASLTLFQPKEEFVFEESMIRSCSKNSAFKGRKLKGRVIGIINKNKFIKN